MILVPIDSPLRRVPKTVERRAVLMLDGIRYSIECYELAWTRLVQTLESLSRSTDNAELPPLIVAATSDAWTMVDSAHRLLRLLDHAPKMKKREPELELFRRGTKEIEDLRNFFQHLGTEITKFWKRSSPLLGTIKWATAGDAPNESILYMIVPGTFYDQIQVLGMTFDTYAGRYIQRIVLEAGHTEIDLADLNTLVERFVGWYTDWFVRTFTGDDHHMFDVRFRMQLTLLPTPPQRIGAEGSAEGQTPPGASPVADARSPDS